MAHHDSDIADFNNHYLMAVKKSLAGGRLGAIQSFQLDARLVEVLGRHIDWSRLATSDCTLVKPNFDATHLRKPSIEYGVLTDALLDDVQNINYKYLMLIRHLAASNVREAVLRTGVDHATASILRSMSAYDLKALAMQHFGVMGKCHLSAKAVAAALSSKLAMPQFVAMFSMRNELCPAH